MALELLDTFNRIKILVLNSINDNYPDNIKADFYKYYKQATEGDCTGKEPWFYEPLKLAKWNAWNSVRGMSSDEAMQEYINLYNEVTLVY